MRVLVVEDEPRVGDLICKVLQRELMDATLAVDGLSGLDQALTGAYDIIVLDRMLPGLDGMGILATLRKERIKTPVLMLTALADLPDRVEGLNQGADDYLGKPFAFSELIARIRSLTRRSGYSAIEEVQAVGPVVVDMSSHRVEREGKVVELSPREFALLETLIRHRGQVLSRDQLIERVWGYDAEPQGNAVDLYIHYLRRKLDPEGKDEPPLIRTIRGTGYQISRG